MSILYIFIFNSFRNKIGHQALLKALEISGHIPMTYFVSDDVILLSTEIASPAVGFPAVNPNCWLWKIEAPGSSCTIRCSNSLPSEGSKVIGWYDFGCSYGITVRYKFYSRATARRQIPENTPSEMQRMWTVRIKVPTVLHASLIRLAGYKLIHAVAGQCPGRSASNTHCPKVHACG